MAGPSQASPKLIDDLETRISEIERQLRHSGANHAYVPTLMTAPGIGWITAFTIAAEIGEIHRFATATELIGYTGLCRVDQAGNTEVRGPWSSPKYLRWGLMEAAIHAHTHHLYAERHQRTKRHLGPQRGAKVAQIELAPGAPRRPGTC